MHEKSRVQDSSAEAEYPYRGAGKERRSDQKRQRARRAAVEFDNVLFKVLVCSVP